MNRSFSLILLTAFAVIASTPAAAQRYDGELSVKPSMQTGSRFARAAESASQSEARDMQRRVGRCVFDRHSDISRKLLAHSDFSRIDFAAIGIAPDELFEELNVARCIERAMTSSTYRMRMNISYSTLRNLLAEEAYREDHKVPIKLDADAVVNLENRYGYERMNQRTATIAKLGDCLVHASPDGTHAFLDARPGTDDEAEAIEALSPALATCLGQGAAPEVSASMMRQVVADGLWSRSYYGAMAADTRTEAEAQ